MTTELIHGFGERPPRLAELNHAGLQIVQGPFDKTVFLLVVCQKVVPKRMLRMPRRLAMVQIMPQDLAHLAQYLGITEDHNTILGTSEGYVQTPRIVQETDTLVLVTPDAAQDNIVLLPSLECINTRHFNVFIQVLLQRTVELHVIDNVGSLALVRGDDANLIGNNPRLEKLGNDLLYV